MKASSCLTGNGASPIVSCATKALKKELRATMRKRLKSLSSEQKRAESLWLQNTLRQDPIFARSKHVALYISMPEEEVDTIPLLRHLLSEGQKVCYVPHIFKDSSVDEIRMLKVESEKDFASFVANKWGILEPPVHTLQTRTDTLKEGGDLDLIIVPGLAFDTNGRRLGRGKGYYDSFFAKCQRIMQQRQKPMPHLVGICFSTQMVEEVPVAPYDYLLDRVLFCPPNMASPRPLQVDKPAPTDEP
ncbi:5-formyltetrahydrofolate cyclo-ligase [Balamuthia mandrillaris]